ncbi:MAG: DUF433 domain-containing protein [Chitinophagaceae bacterium]
MIECNPEINFGMPALKGRRLTVYDIVTKLYYEESIEIAINDYEISMRDAKEALLYCMNLRCKKDKNRVHFCDGCILRTFEEGSDFDRDNYIEARVDGEMITISRDESIFFAGSLEELEDSEFGKVTWLIAEELNKSI